MHKKRIIVSNTIQPVQLRFVVDFENPELIEACGEIAKTYGYAVPGDLTSEELIYETVRYLGDFLFGVSLESETNLEETAKFSLPGIGKLDGSFGIKLVYQSGEYLSPQTTSTIVKVFDDSEEFYE